MLQFFILQNTNTKDGGLRACQKHMMLNINFMQIKKNHMASEMAQQVKTLAAKPEDLSMFEPWDPLEKGRSDLCKLSLDLHMYPVAGYAHECVHTEYRNK